MSRCVTGLLAAHSIKGRYGRHFALYDDKLRGTAAAPPGHNGRNGDSPSRQFEVYLQPKYRSGTDGFPGRGRCAGTIRMPAAAAVGILFPFSNATVSITRLDQYVWETRLRLMQEWIGTGIPALVSRSMSSWMDRIRGFGRDSHRLQSGMNCRPPAFIWRSTGKRLHETSNSCSETLGNLRKLGFYHRDG